MGQKTVLLFDDNEMCRSMLAEILVEKQFQVVAFSDPASFFAYKEQPCCHQDSTPCFDVLLTDKQMPGMTGLEFLEQLKCAGCKIPNHNKAVISGNWSAVDLKHADRLGCKVFHKPAPLDEVFSWLDDCESLLEQR